MALPTAVNGQITDAVTQANVEVLGDAPAQAMGSLYQSISSSVGLASQNAVANQQSVNSLGNAVTTKCVASLLGDAASV